MVEVNGKGGIDSHWVWRYASENGGTRITMTVEYSIPIPVLGKLAETIIIKQNDAEMDTMLGNIKTRMEMPESVPAS